MAAPGFSGMTSAAKVVVVMIMQVKENWKIPQPRDDISQLFKIKVDFS